MRRLHVLTAAALLAAALLAVGCGSDDEKTVVEQRTVTDTVTATTEEETTSTATTTEPPSGPTDCGNVNVELAQGSEGGANSVEATAVDCAAALDLARECVRGGVPSGWSVSGALGEPTLTKGSESVSFTLVGGGGCQPVE